MVLRAALHRLHPPETVLLRIPLLPAPRLSEASPTLGPHSTTQMTYEYGYSSASSSMLHSKRSSMELPFSAYNNNWTINLGPRSGGLGTCSDTHR
ncbi:hypothetical protein BDZ97DRAFT_486655 [Flammula alnicola]|nr:hypothetical protein BDZ97DRAFT_486655 [Flammula alnicola]